MASKSVFRDLELSGIAYISGEDERAYAYLADTSGFDGISPVIVLPGTEEELVEAARILMKNRIPLTTRGSGTGTAGGTLAEKSALLVTTRLTDFKIHEEKFIAEVEPGVMTGELKDAASKRGLLYPPDPASYRFSTIGGNIATNAGGPGTVRYGTTRDYVKKLRMVDGRGRLLTFGESVHKFSSGYFLPSLFCGSEGTLGILTRAWVRLVPEPRCFHFYEVKGPKFEDFHDFRLLGPAKMEYMDPTAGELVTGKKESYLLLAIEEFTEEAVKGMRKRFENYFRSAGYEYRDGSTREDIWEVRSRLSPLSYSIAPVKVSQDIVVPLDKIPEFVTWLDSVRKESSECHIFSFGHIGDGNLHVNIMVEEEGRALALEVQEKIMEKVRGLGGMPSGEHGVGTLRKRYLKDFIGKDELEMMVGIKKIFDPENLLNPGKVI